MSHFIRIPDNNLHTDRGELSFCNPFVNKGLFPDRIIGLFHHLCLALGIFRSLWKKVTGMKGKIHNLMLNHTMDILLSKTECIWVQKMSTDNSCENLRFYERINGVFVSV